MRTTNNENKIDRANGAADNASKEEGTMRNSSKKTPWHLRFAPGAILRQIGLAVLTLTMLVGVQNAEAQSPDIEVYGIDSHSVLQYFGGRWHETLSKMNLIARPGGAVEGKANYRANHLFPCNPGSKYSILKVRVQNTTWFSDGTHSDIEHYDVHCGTRTAPERRLFRISCAVFE